MTQYACRRQATQFAGSRPKGLIRAKWVQAQLATHALATDRSDDWSTPTKRSWSLLAERKLMTKHQPAVTPWQVDAQDDPRNSPLSW